MIKIKSLLLSGVGVSIAVLIGRLFGFLREILQASSFGQSYQADALSLSLILPDILVNVALGGAFSAAFMPVFVHLDPTQSFNFVKSLHKKLGAVSLLIALIIFTLSEKLTLFIAPDMKYEGQILLSVLLKITCWSIPFIVFSGIVTVEMNARHVFFMPALGTVVFNFFICLGLISTFYLNNLGIYIVSFSMIFAVVLRWIFQVYPYKEINKSSSSEININNFNKNKIFGRYFHTIFSVSVLILMPLLGRYYMLQTGQGQMANYNYAQKLIDLFVTLLVGSIITVIMPKIARKDCDSIKDIYKISLFLFSSFIIFSFLYYFLSPFLAKTLFYHGAFDINAIHNLTLHMQNSAYMLPFYALMYYLTSSLAVTDLSFRNAAACLASIVIFVLLIESQIKSIHFSDVYKYMCLSYLACMCLQFLFIFQHERKSNAKAYVYH